jgi:hypothetical protein
LFGEDRTGLVEKTVELGELSARLAVPLVAVWTLALIPIRLVGPRPRLRRLARQPGMTAICAAGAAFAVVGPFGLIEVFADQGAPSLICVSLYWTPLFVPMFVGWAVLVSWMTLLIGRRWRAERSWVDRAGRATGVFWILACLAVTALFLVYPLMMTSEFRVLRFWQVPAAETRDGIADCLPDEPLPVLPEP